MALQRHISYHLEAKDFDGFMSQLKKDGCNIQYRHRGAGSDYYEVFKEGAVFCMTPVIDDRNVRERSVEGYEIFIPENSPADALLRSYLQ